MVEGGVVWVREDLLVRKVSGKGRGVFASAPIPAGSLIAVEPALALSLSPSKALFVCNACAAPVAKEATPFVGCPACPQLHFCSPQCWRRERNLVHWLECEADEALLDGPGSLFRLAVRLYLATPAHFRHAWDKHRRCVADEDTPLYALVGATETYLTLAASLPLHREAVKASANYSNIKQRLLAIAGRMVEIGEADNAVKAACRLAHCLMVSYTNSFTIYDCSVKPGDLPKETPMGVGLYPGVSLLNHSCLPNTTRIFRGNKMFMRVIRDVDVGGELTISYGTDVRGQRTPERQLALKSWHFHCLCDEACGNPVFLLREARHWGFACLTCNLGAALPVRQDWTLSKACALVTEHGCDLGLISTPLGIRCINCGRQSLIPTSGVRDIVYVLMVLQHNVPFDKNLPSLVHRLHPDNYIRLQALWQSEFHRCERNGQVLLDEEAMSAGDALLKAAAHLTGPDDMLLAHETLRYYRLLKDLPRTEAVARRLLTLPHRISRIVAIHFGLESPEFAALQSL